MKKLLVSAVAVAALAAPAMAQEWVPAEYENSAMIEQIGTANSAIVNQRWGGLLNGQSLAEIEQRGDGNSTTARQSSLGSQNDGDFDNELDISQTGDYGDVIALQVHDYDNGRANRGIIRQRTDNATARLRQRGDWNIGRIRQRASAIDPVAVVEQNGTRNRGFIDQYGDGGRVRIFQGDFAGPNSVHSPDSFNNLAEVWSYGSNADILINQLGDSQANSAYVEETGIDAVTTINTVTGFFNEATVYQAGESGTVQIDQLGSFASKATVQQEASDVGSSATIMQTGWYTESEITQLDTDGLGGHNIAISTQSTFALSEDQVDSTILQDGASNFANVTQTSAIAQSTVNQVGSSHTANVSQ